MDSAAANRTAPAAALARARPPASAPPWQAPPTRVLLPKNLSAYRQLPELLGVFEAILPANAAHEVAPSDAVAALNHLKRLQRQAAGDPRLAARADACTRAFAATAREGLDAMSAKNVALAMNSLAARGDNGPFLEAAARRVRDLCRAGHDFHTQVPPPPAAAAPPPPPPSPPRASAEADPERARAGTPRAPRAVRGGAAARRRGARVRGDCDGSGDGGGSGTGGGVGSERACRGRGCG
jgi:hypothetical protein